MPCAGQNLILQAKSVRQKKKSLWQGGARKKHPPWTLKLGLGVNRPWVTQKNKGGLLPDEYRFDGGWLWRRGQRIDTPSEKVIFDLIGGMIPATDRDQWRKHFPFYGNVSVEGKLS